jgi:hypothetical protein
LIFAQGSACREIDRGGFGEALIIAEKFRAGVTDKSLITGDTTYTSAVYTRNL